jgi:hypothetical protein
MPRTDEAEAFFYAVYSAIQEIPPGKVTTYGHIAKLVGTRKLPVTIDSYQSLHIFSFLLYSILKLQLSQVKY